MQVLSVAMPSRHRAGRSGSPDQRSAETDGIEPGTFATFVTSATSMTLEALDHVVQRPDSANDGDGHGDGPLHGRRRGEVVVGGEPFETIQILGPHHGLPHWAQEGRDVGEEGVDLQDDIHRTGPPE